MIKQMSLSSIISFNFTQTEAQTKRLLSGSVPVNLVLAYYTHKYVAISLPHLT